MYREILKNEDKKKEHPFPREVWISLYRPAKKETNPITDCPLLRIFCKKTDSGSLKTGSALWGQQSVEKQGWVLGERREREERWKLVVVVVVLVLLHVWWVLGTIVMDFLLWWWWCLLCLLLMQKPVRCFFLYPSGTTTTAATILISRAAKRSLP